MGEQVTASTMSENWTHEQIETLIDTYRKERVLYVRQLPNYYNKRLRHQALQRICQAVSKVRPKTTADECQKKIGLFRNQYNRESVKIKNSLRTGTCPDDIYIPSLWYYDKITFLEPYVQAQKRQKSLDAESLVLESQSLTICQSEHIELPEVIFKQEDIESQSEMTSDCEQEQLHAIAASSIHEESAAFGQRHPTSPTPSKSCRFSARLRRSVKKPRLDSSEDELSDMSDPADSVGQPTTTNANTGSTSVSMEDPTVDGFLTFLGTLLRSFQNEDLKLEVMNTVTQTVVNAKSTDLRRTNQLL